MPADDRDVPPMAIVMLVCGTRGDVQPFVALGMELKKYGHRVRLATHASFQKMVEGHALEFYPLGGDPQQLSAYMVQNRGILPSPSGYLQIGDQRKMLKEVIWSCWPACTQPSPSQPDLPFFAEAIIANPVSYGHVHCAEKLKVPLHMLFTMPWTPTGAFPHPMARMFYAYKLPNGLTRLSGKAAYYANTADAYKDVAKAGGLFWPVGQKVLGWVFKAEALAARVLLKQIEMANVLSYHAVEDIMNTGMADLLSQFRTEVLGLPSLYSQNGVLRSSSIHKVPFTYCFSPTLVKRPSDWPEDLVDIAGFFFIDDGGAGSYEPPREIEDFLAAGERPVYFGFGSLVVPNPQELTKKILKALAQTGQRGIISSGWGKLGKIDGHPLPPNVLVVDAVPHEYLFPQCAAVVHHGGAGTTAAGLRAGCPTFVVSFFGDQPFWGEACRRIGVGPKPVSIDGFNRHKLVKALRFMARREVKKKAMKVAAQICRERGVANGMASFHRHLPAEYLERIRKKRAGPPRLESAGQPPLLPPPPEPKQERAASGWVPHGCLPRIPVPTLGRIPIPRISPWSWRGAARADPSETSGLGGQIADSRAGTGDSPSHAPPEEWNGKFAAAHEMPGPAAGESAPAADESFPRANESAPNARDSAPAAHESSSAAAAPPRPLEGSSAPPVLQPSAIQQLPTPFQAASLRQFSRDLPPITNRSEMVV